MVKRFFLIILTILATAGFLRGGGNTQQGGFAPWPPSDMSVTFSGGIFGAGATWNGTNCTDAGDYVGEFVREKSCVITNASFPDWRVWIRPDASITTGGRIASPNTGWRDEVIIEYGRSTHGTPSNVYASYTATITKGGTQVYSTLIPWQGWYTRWRWFQYQGASGPATGVPPRPSVRSVASLKSRGFLPNFNVGGLYGQTANPNAPVVWPGPMVTPRDPNIQTWQNASSFNTFMGDTGDNLELGHLTEYEARCMMFPAESNSCSNIWAEAEWMAMWPDHIRDDTTGGPFSPQPGYYPYQWATTPPVLGSGGLNGASLVQPSPAATFATALDSTSPGPLNIGVNGGSVWPSTVPFFIGTDYEILKVTSITAGGCSAGAACWTVSRGQFSTPLRAAAIGSAMDVPLNANGGPSGFLIDMAFSGQHIYANGWFEWALTDDPFYLEEIQHHINRFILANGGTRQGAWGAAGGCGVDLSDDRGTGWSIRTLLRAQAGTNSLTSVPSWLFSKAFYTACVQDNKDLFNLAMGSPSRITSLFKIYPATDVVDWTRFFLDAPLGYATALTGDSYWSTIFAWSADHEIQLTNNTSGWRRQWPVTSGLVPRIPPVNNFNITPLYWWGEKPLGWTGAAPGATRTQNTAYPAGTMILDSGNVYYITGGNSACTSGSSATLTAPPSYGGTVNDGTCQWSFIGPNPDTDPGTYSSWATLWTGFMNGGNGGYCCQISGRTFPLTDTLGSNIDGSSQPVSFTVNVDNAIFPCSNNVISVYIDTEAMTIDSGNSCSSSPAVQTWTSNHRGLNGTTIAAHSSGALIYQAINTTAPLWDGVTLAQNSVGPGYLISHYLQLRAVLALAKTAGLPGASTIWTWYAGNDNVSGAMAGLMTTANKVGQARFSIDP